MTGNLLVDSLISIAGIAVLVLVARLLFPAGRQTISKDDAKERLTFEEPDFEAIDWLIDDQGKCALAQGAAGEFALIRKLGLDLVVRRFPGEAVRASLEDGRLILRFADASFSRASLASADAPAWARKFGVKEYN